MNQADLIHFRAKPLSFSLYDTPRSLHNIEFTDSFSKDFPRWLNHYASFLFLQNNYPKPSHPKILHPLSDSPNVNSLPACGWKRTEVVPRPPHLWCNRASFLIYIYFFSFQCAPLYQVLINLEPCRRRLFRQFDLVCQKGNKSWRGARCRNSTRRRRRRVHFGRWFTDVFLAKKTRSLRVRFFFLFFRGVDFFLEWGKDFCRWGGRARYFRW